VSTPVLWTLVDAISAYALVETWRARSGVGKGKKDVLLAVLCVFDLQMSVETDEVVICQLLVQPVSISPFAGVLYVIDIEHVALVEYHVCCTRSVNLPRGVVYRQLIPTTD